jgi:hypothetical protein
MKEDSFEDIPIEDTLFSSFCQSDKNLFSKINITCSENQPGESYCIDCEKAAVICAKKNCPCINFLKKC